MQKPILILIICLVAIILWFIFKKIIIIGDSIGIKQNIKFNYQPENKFTYNVQYAHFDNNQTEEKGEITQAKLLLAFDNFPWAEEFTKPNIKTSPTIGISDRLKKRELGISIVGINNNEKYFHLFFVTENDVKVKENVNEAYTKQIINNFFERNDEFLNNEFK